MKVFVFAYDRYTDMTTPNLLTAEGITPTVLCHTQEAADLFVEGGTARHGDLEVTGKPRGLAYQRNYALDQMEEGEWALFLVDDLIRVTELDTYNTESTEVLPIDVTNATKEWKPRFATTIRMSDFLMRVDQTIAFGDRAGANLVGWAGIDNALYRKRHWSQNVLADGRAWAVRKTHLRFDEKAQMIDDLCWTAQNIREFGIVIVNQWVMPLCRRYTAGGFGSIDQRMRQKLTEAKHLVDTYPDLIMYKKKAGWPDGSHVVLRPSGKRYR